jgi:uncharacterized protein YdcH (DUF465 family)
VARSAYVDRRKIGSQPMAKPATHVVKRFPEHELAIERLVRKSESFRSMCDDYAVGLEALRRWERASDPKAAVRIAELRQSLLELEEEMLEALEQEATACSGRRRREDGP